MRINFYDENHMILETPTAVEQLCKHNIKVRFVIIMKTAVEGNQDFAEFLQRTITDCWVRLIILGL